MGIFNKTKQEPAHEHDFTSIDAAVSELTKQTDALLGDPQEKIEEVPKPTLPKMNSKPSMRGTSFDIIQDPNRTTKLKSTLKTPAPLDVKALEEELEETPRLPDHATKSFNELVTPERIEKNVESDILKTLEASEPDIKAIVETDSEATVQPPAVIQHHEGNFSAYGSGPMGEQEVATPLDAPSEKKKKIHLTPDSDKLGDENVKVKTDPSDELSEEDEVITPEVSISSEGAVSSASSILPETKVVSDTKNTDSEPADEPEIPKETDEEEKVTEKTEEIEKPEKTPDPEEKTPVEDTSYNSGELFANNLVKDTQPKGFEAEEKEAPAVFDTTEYHPELHDWSQLESSSGLKWFVIAVLLIIVAAGAWFVLSGQELPF